MGLEKCDLIRHGDWVMRCVIGGYFVIPFWRKKVVIFVGSGGGGGNNHMGVEI